MENFIIVWTIDGETMTQDQALHLAETLLREHGCDLEITLHLDDDISPPPSIWFNKSGCANGVLLDSHPSESKCALKAFMAGRSRKAGHGSRRAQAC